MGGVNQTPNGQSVLGGQCLQYKGHIGRVQPINPGPQMGQMLGLSHPLGEALAMVIWPRLTSGQVAHQAESAQ